MLSLNSAIVISAKGKLVSCLYGPLYVTSRSTSYVNIFGSRTLVLSAECIEKSRVVPSFVIVSVVIMGLSVI